MRSAQKRNVWTFQKTGHKSQAVSGHSLSRALGTQPPTHKAPHPEVKQKPSPAGPEEGTLVLSQSPEPRGGKTPTSPTAWLGPGWGQSAPNPSLSPGWLARQYTPC